MTEIIPKLEYVTIKRSEYDYLRAVVEDDWQPIAKHHGRMRDELLWIPAPELNEGGYVCIGSINDYGDWYDDEGSKINPSHWMPLPEPPRGDNG